MEQKWCRWCQYALLDWSAWYTVCAIDKSKHKWINDGCGLFESREYKDDKVYYSPNLQKRFDKIYQELLKEKERS